MTNILLIDDHPQIQHLVKRILTKNHYEVTCQAGIDREDLSSLKAFDLILLDVMLGLPYDGYDICQSIREELDLPIIFLTALTTDDDLVKGFSLGADDYIKKPFSPSELLARVEAHLRRTQRNKDASRKLNFETITLNLDEKAIYISGERIYLTRKEYELVELLAQYPQKVFSIQEIYETIYDMDSDSLFRGVSEFIYQIRKKLKAYDVNPIKTIRGIGYQWQTEA